jgi:hypothetical protein
VLAKGMCRDTVSRDILPYQDIFCRIKIYFAVSRYILPYQDIFCRIKNIFCRIKIYFAVSRYILPYQDIFCRIKRCIFCCIKRYFAILESITGADPGFLEGGVKPLKKGTHGERRRREAPSGGLGGGLPQKNLKYAFSWHLGMRFHSFLVAKKNSFFLGKIFGFVQ